jgi:hypothetical protein
MVRYGEMKKNSGSIAIVQKKGWRSEGLERLCHVWGALDPSRCAPAPGAAGRTSFGDAAHGT